MQGLVCLTSVTVAYILLYSGYSKSTRSLSPAQLVDLFTLQKGFSGLALELNKVCALSGLTCLGLCFLPGATRITGGRGELLWPSLYMLWMHAVFSLFKYYGTANIPSINTWPSVGSDLASSIAKTRLVGLKKLSVFCGVSALSLLDLMFFNVLSVSAILALVVLVLALCHFWMMETQINFRLGVRPIGYLAFIIPIIAIVALSVIIVIQILFPHITWLMYFFDISTF